MSKVKQPFDLKYLGEKFSEPNLNFISKIKVQILEDLEQIAILQCLHKSHYEEIFSNISKLIRFSRSKLEIFGTV